MDTTSFTKKSISGVAIVEPALTPPPIAVTQTTFAKKTKIGTGKSKTKKRDIPEGLWTKCPSCETMIFDKELDENLKCLQDCVQTEPVFLADRQKLQELMGSKSVRALLDEGCCSQPRPAVKKCSAH